MQKFDVAIIGAGSGGYRAAEILAKENKKVILFEKLDIGGVCLNWGCISTKALVASVELLEQLRMSERFGIKSSFEIDFSKIMARKEKIVKMLSLGLQKKLISMGITIIKSEAKMKSKNEISANNEEYYIEKIIIATGSIDAGLKEIDFDKDEILSSKDILSLKEIPKRITVIGAGVIGAEFSSIFAHLGSKVTLIEYFPKPFYTTQSSLIMNEGERILKKAGIDLKCSSTVVSIDKKNKKIMLSDNSSVEYDKVLVATGRKPIVNSDAKNIGIEITEKGFIKTDKNKKTNIENIYAVGDCTEGPMLAHKAYYDAYIASMHILGNKEEQMKMSDIPYSIFTLPSISHCKLTEDMCIEQKINYRKIESSYAENGRAATYEARQGIFSMLIGENNRIIGVTIIGKESDILIHEIIPLIHNNIPYTALKRSVHIHPTLSEIIWESIL